MTRSRRANAAAALATLIDGLHAAALDGTPGAWTGALERVADAFGAGSAYLQPCGGGTSWGPGGPVAVRADPAWARSYVEHYGRLDPIVPAAIRLLAPGQAMAGRQVMEPDALWRTEYGQDWCRPQGMIETALGLLTTGSSDPEGGWGMLVLCRGHGAEPFGRAETRRLEALLPHVRHAVAARLRLGAAVAERDAMATALDLDPRGTMLVDGHGRVVFANRAAEAFLAGPSGPLVRTVDGTLRAAPWAGASLERSLRRLLAFAAGQGATGLHAGGALSLPSRPGQPCAGHAGTARPVVLRAIPLAGHGGGVGAAAVVLIEGLPRPAAGPDALQAGVQGLTPAEARVAELIAGRGLGVKAVARELGVSPNTVRTHLQRVFEKTGTHRQAELVARLRDAG